MGPNEAGWGAAHEQLSTGVVDCATVEGVVTICVQKPHAGWTQDIRRLAVVHTGCM